MGNSKSKKATIDGDSNVNIINQLDHHSELHEDHDLKLWIIIFFNLLQILIMIVKWYNKKITKKAFRKGCASSDNLDKV